MKTVLTFLVLFVVTALYAQQAGIPFEKRKAFEATLHSNHLTYPSSKPYQTTSLQKSDLQAWQKSADEVIANSHRIYSVDMVDSSIIWMVSTYDAFPPPANALPYILKSIDGGATWEQYSLPDTEGNYAFDIAAVSEQTAYAIINDEDFSDDNFGNFIYQTQDGGQNWSIVENYPFSPSFIHFFDESNGWVMGVDTAGVGFITMSITSDGGANWSHAGGNDWFTPAEGMSLPEPDSTEFVGAWGFAANTVYEAVDSVVLLSGSNKRYWISEDYGYTWENFDSPLPATHMTSLVAMKNRDTFMLASNISVDFTELLSPLAFTTTDGGETWIESETDGHLAAINYLPGTEQSFISVGHANFGVGSVGTYRTDDLFNWQEVDDLPLIAMDFAGELQGTGALGNIPGLGDNGNIYKWEVLPPYAIDFELFTSTDYTVSKREHIDELFFDIGLENVGVLDLSTITATLAVTQDETVVYEEQRSIELLSVDGLTDFSFDYTPTTVGAYNYQLTLNNAELGGDFEVINRPFTLSDSTLAKDDGTVEADFGFGFGDPNWYGYYGSEFRLLEADTLRSIEVFVSDGSDIDGTFNLGVYSMVGTSFVNREPIHSSVELAVADADPENGNYRYTLPEPLPMDRGRYVFAAGQDTLQGIVGFGFDMQTLNNGYWIVSPVAGGGYPWSKFEDDFRPTLAIRANFQQSDLISNVKEWNSSPAPFQVFPNPFRDQLNLAFAKGNHSNFWIELTDVQGKVLLTQQIVHGSTQNWNWKHLASGLYFLKVTDGKEIWVEKVVKE